MSQRFEPDSIWQRELVRSNGSTFVKKLRDGRQQWRASALLGFHITAHHLGPFLMYLDCSCMAAYQQKKIKKSSILIEPT